MEAFKGDGNGGLGWADQWDYKFNDKERMEAEKRDKKRRQSSGGGDGLAGKIKDKAKVAALAGAQKIKSGTNSGVQWIKDKYQQQKAKKAEP